MASWSESRRPIGAATWMSADPPIGEAVEQADGTVLSVALDSNGTVCRLHLAGKLIRTSIAALEAQVDQLGCISFDRVVLDLVGLTGLDSVGANVLHGLQEYVRGRGGTLEVLGRACWVAMLPRLGALE